MSNFAIYLLCVFLAVAFLSLAAWDELRTNSQAQLTLNHILVGLVLALIPGINAGVSVLIICLFISEYGSKIVLFGKKT